MSYIQFLGAAGTVTGSKHLINTGTDGSGHNGFQVLVDCGMFQGPEGMARAQLAGVAHSGAAALMPSSSPTRTSTTAAGFRAW